MISWMVSDARFGDKPSLHMWVQSQVKPVGWMVTWIWISPMDTFGFKSSEMSRENLPERSDVTEFPCLITELLSSRAFKTSKNPCNSEKFGRLEPSLWRSCMQLPGTAHATGGLGRLQLSLNMLNHYHQSCASMFNLDVSETHPLQG